MDQDFHPYERRDEVQVSYADFAGQKAGAIPTSPTLSAAKFPPSPAGLTHTTDPSPRQLITSWAVRSQSHITTTTCPVLLHSATLMMDTDYTRAEARGQTSLLLSDLRLDLATVAYMP